MVPPEHVPVVVRVQLEQPEHDAPADAQPELVYLPLQVLVYERVEPLYEHVPFDIVHERVQDSLPESVDVVLDVAVHNVLQVWVLIEHVHDDDFALHAP